MQKIIVSDASPIGYLIRIDKLELLEIIYGAIIIPEAVYQEIFRLENLGYNLSAFKNSKWIKVLKPIDISNIDTYKSILDKGELEALSIAISYNADLVIIDEKLGRFVAKQIGFDITGLVGILIAAKIRGHITSIKKILDSVIALGFRISKNLYITTLIAYNEQ
ncbi:MAG: DUF3368 domain-containing protein [Ginsengibacter sp.]